MRTWLVVVPVALAGCGFVAVSEEPADAGGTVSSAGGSAQGGGMSLGGGSVGGGAASGGGVASAGGSAGGASLPNFSFFVTSLVAMRALSGSANGFGGDLRFGETGAGAGLRGADKLCATIAERSMPGASAKQWRAFLSVGADASGARVNAIDRIGNGPWYDRTGRVVALTKADLVAQRPATADVAIRRDLPNEDGVPNHAPDGPTVDNHDTLTGSTTAGLLARLSLHVASDALNTSGTCTIFVALDQFAAPRLSDGPCSRQQSRRSEYHKAHRPRPGARSPISA